MSQPENPFAAPQADISAYAGPVPAEAADAERIRRAHIGTETSVRTIGILYYLSAIIAGAVVVATLAHPAEWGPFSVVSLLLVVPYVLVGSGLRRLRTWARWVAVALAVPGLLAIPIGTLVSAYILYLLLASKGAMVFTPEYAEIIRQTPHVKYETSWIVRVLLGVLIFVFLLALLAPFLVGG